MPKIIYEVMTTRWMLSKRSLDDILNMAPMKDWKKLAVLRILEAISAALFRSNQQLAPIIVCRSIKLTLKYGLSSMACNNFVVMCLLLSHPLGKEKNYSTNVHFQKL